MKDRRKNRDIPPPPKLDAWEAITLLGLIVITVVVMWGMLG